MSEHLQLQFAWGDLVDVISDEVDVNDDAVVCGNVELERNVGIDGDEELEDDGERVEVSDDDGDNVDDVVAA